jgi:hypothetical protein
MPKVNLKAVLLAAVAIAPASACRVEGVGPESDGEPRIESERPADLEDSALEVSYRWMIDDLEREDDGTSNTYFVRATEYGEASDALLKRLSRPGRPVHRLETTRNSVIGARGVVLRVTEVRQSRDGTLDLDVWADFDYSVQGPCNVSASLTLAKVRGTWTVRDVEMCWGR